MPPQATPFAFLLKEGIADSKPSIRPLVGVVSLLRTTLARGWLKRCFADLGGESAPVSDTLDLLFFIGGAPTVRLPTGGRSEQPKRPITPTAAEWSGIFLFATLDSWPGRVTG